MTIEILPPTEPIPVRATVSAAMRLVASEWRELLKLLFFPCLLLGIVSAFISASQDPVSLFAAKAGILPVNGTVETHLYALFFTLLNLMLQCWLGVAVFRYVILGEKSVGWLPPYQPCMWHYLWRFILLGLVLVVPFVLVTFALFMFLPKLVAAILALLCFLGLAIMGARIVLALPATAVGRDYYFRSAWQRTRGQALRIMTIKFLAGLFLILPLIIIFIVVAAIGQMAPGLAKTISFTLVTMSQLAVTYVVDSLLYAYFYQGAEIAAPAQAPHGF